MAQDMTDNQLFDVLRPTFAPCPNFALACSGYCRWVPQSGHVPRGFGGAVGAISDIRLALVTAEPGDPADGESYSGSPDQMFHESMSMFTRSLDEDGLRRGGQTAPFHKNLRKILDLCWPQDSFEDQLRKTWFTNAVLCSALVSGGSVPRAIEDTCVSAYLARQIDLLENAFVLTLGGKAEHRLQRNGVRVDFGAQHPSARPNTRPDESWVKAASAFHAWLECHFLSAP
jgi:hypothetical protein